VKYLFVDFFSASNRGDAAILEGMKNDFYSVDENADIEVLAYHKASVKHINKMKSDDVLIPTLSYSFKFFAFISILFLYAKTKSSFFFKLLPKNKQQVINKYLSADVIVSVGGGNLNDNYSRDLVGRLLGLLFAIKLNKKVILYSQSIGPFNKLPYRKLAKYILNQADLIIPREDISLKLLNEAGITKPKIAVTTDSAFSLRTANKPSISDEKYVTLSIRKWQYDGYDDKLKIEMAKYIDWLILEKNIRVDFVSSCTGFAGYHTDDRLVGLDLQNMISDKAQSKYSVIMDELSPYDLMDIYSGALFHVGMRMHSCILAFNSGTPFIPIVYEHKTVGISKHAGFDEFLIWANDVNVTILTEYSEKMITDNQMYRDRIIEKTKSVEQLTSQNRALLTESLF